jgi:hypothetical protein
LPRSDNAHEDGEQYRHGSGRVCCHLCVTIISLVPTFARSQTGAQRVKISIPDLAAGCLPWPIQGFLAQSQALNQLALTFVLVCLTEGTHANFFVGQIFDGRRDNGLSLLPGFTAPGNP